MKKNGFTLIEILVSVALFSVVMVIAMGSLLAMSTSDRKAESLKVAINNLNFALDSMSRAIRTGTNYHCGSVTGQDCQSGANVFYFTDASGRQIGYQLDSTNATTCGQPAGQVGCIERSINGAAWTPITAPEIVITDFSTKSPASYLFYVVGSNPGPSDTTQPKVTITLSGTVTVTATQNTTLYLQTSVTQRVYDQ